MGKIRRRSKCPKCGSLNVIKWGVQCGCQRYKCKDCGNCFTQTRQDVVSQTSFYGFGSGYPGNNASRISPKKAVIVPDNSVAGPTAILLRLLSGRYSEKRNYCRFFGRRPLRTWQGRPLFRSHPRDARAPLRGLAWLLSRGSHLPLSQRPSASLYMQIVIFRILVWPANTTSYAMC
jgi:hypothetical protein